MIVPEAETKSLTILVRSNVTIPAVEEGEADKTEKNVVAIISAPIGPDDSIDSLLKRIKVGDITVLIKWFIICREILM